MTARRALLVGGTSDMARHLARRLAASGTELVLTARREADLDDLVDELRGEGGPDGTRPPVETLALDLLDPERAEALVAALEPAPDLVVVFAGIMEPGQGERPTAREIERVLAVNFAGCARVLEAAARRLEAVGAGTLVGVSSVAGDRGRWSNYLYGSSKAGLTAYLSGLRAHLAPKGVGVLTVKPGLIRTRMTAHRNLPPLVTGDPDRVARAVVRAVDRGRNVIYVPWFWRWIMLVVRLLPEPLFKRLRF